MPISVKVSGDPKRPADVVPYKLARKDLDAPKGDMMSLFAMILALAAMLLKIKALAFVSLVACLASLANARTGDSDPKQTVSAAVMAVFALVGSYLAQPPAVNPSPPTKAA